MLKVFPKKVIYEAISPISGKVEVIDGLHGLELHINGATQTVKMQKNKRPNYWEIAADLIDISQHSKVLLLGLGGGEIVRLLLNKMPNLDITVVELDPLIIDIYKRYFKEPKQNPKIISADAYEYVLNLKEKFDLIFTDIYFRDSFPKEFLEEAFLTKVSASLTSQGTYVYNCVINDFDAKKRTKKLEQIFKEFFKEVAYKRVNQNLLNYLFFASN